MHGAEVNACLRVCLKPNGEGWQVETVAAPFWPLTALNRRQAMWPQLVVHEQRSEYYSCYI